MCERCVWALIQLASQHMHAIAVWDYYTSFLPWIFICMSWSNPVCHAKKVVSDSPGLVDFAIGWAIFVLNLPNGQLLFFGGKFNFKKDCNQSCQSKRVLGLVEKTCGLVHASYSLPEWQAVKLTFFAPYCLNLGMGVTWITHTYPLVILNGYIRMTILFSLTTFKIDFQGAGVTWTTHMSPLVISTSKSLFYLA